MKSPSAAGELGVGRRCRDLLKPLQHVLVQRAQQPPVPLVVAPRPPQVGNRQQARDPGHMDGPDLDEEIGGLGAGTRGQQQGVAEADLEAAPTPVRGDLHRLETEEVGGGHQAVHGVAGGGGGVVPADNDLIVGVGPPGSTRPAAIPRVQEAPRERHMHIHPRASISQQRAQMGALSQREAESRRVLPIVVWEIPPTEALGVVSAPGALGGVGALVVALVLSQPGVRVTPCVNVIPDTILPLESQQRAVSRVRQGLGIRCRCRQRAEVRGEKGRESLDTIRGRRGGNSGGGGGLTTRLRARNDQNAVLNPIEVDPVNIQRLGLPRSEHPVAPHIHPVAHMQHPDLLREMRRRVARPPVLGRVPVRDKLVGHRRGRGGVVRRARRCDQPGRDGHGVPRAGLGGVKTDLQAVGSAGVAGAGGPGEADGGDGGGGGAGAAIPVAAAVGDGHGPGSGEPLDLGLGGKNLVKIQEDLPIVTSPPRLEHRHIRGRQGRHRKLPPALRPDRPQLVACLVLHHPGLTQHHVGGPRLQGRPRRSRQRPGALNVGAGGLPGTGGDDDGVADVHRFVGGVFGNREGVGVHDRHRQVLVIDPRITHLRPTRHPGHHHRIPGGQAVGRQSEAGRAPRRHLRHLLHVLLLDHQQLTSAAAHLLVEGEQVVLGGGAQQGSRGRVGQGGVEGWGGGLQGGGALHEFERIVLSGELDISVSSPAQPLSLESHLEPAVVKIKRPTHVHLVLVGIPRQRHHRLRRILIVRGPANKIRPAPLHRHRVPRPRDQSHRLRQDQRRRGDRRRLSV
mmetsp:Transcript_42688/g.96160  ORF Transcript_42688/g.96160 Transcript_42688/m.96160 type:complete len:792 (-) Transcript_42688:2864-5239(-)